MQHATRQSVAASAPAPQPVELQPVPQQVRIIAGADVQDLDLAGRTVGEARVVAQALFGTNAAAVALVDGVEVDEQRLLRTGEQLEFVKYAGNKGAGIARAAQAIVDATGAVIELTGAQVVWRRNGRRAGAVALEDLVAQIGMTGQDPASWRLCPRGVRLMVERRRGEVTGVVIEMPPGPRQVRWIRDDSLDPFGPRAQYDTRYLSFPWVVLLIVFVGGELSHLQQAFYRTAPIGSLDDELCYTNLLNVAAGYEQESWVCLVNLESALAPLSWEQRVHAITDHFWRAAFNRSSEVHEGNSFWSSMRKLDRRLSTAERWEQATRDDPYFALHVKWRPTGAGVGATLARMLDKIAPWRRIERVEQLITLMQSVE